MPINWVDVPDPKNPPAGAPKLSAANLARLALIEDIGTAGTPTGDAGRAAFGHACSTDGTNSLPAPTGIGLEFVITTTGGVVGLQDIRFNGTSL